MNYRELILLKCFNRNRKAFVISLLFVLSVGLVSLNAQRQTVTFDLNVGSALSWASSNNLLYKLHDFEHGYNAELLANIPLYQNYSFSVGVGLSNLRTSLFYDFDSVETSYFSKNIDARDLVWETYTSYIIFPVYANMESDAIKEKMSMMLSAGLIPKKQVRQEFYILNGTKEEFYDITQMKEFDISFVLRFILRLRINKNHVLLSQFYYERGLVPIQKFEVPVINYTSIGFKLGWNFSLDR